MGDADLLVEVFYGFVLEAIRISLGVDPSAKSSTLRASESRFLLVGGLLRARSLID
jgi:hypothetical protein